MTPFTKAVTSACVMRFLGPDPVTWDTLTPSSRANLRTEGDAWLDDVEPTPAGMAGACANADGASFGAAAAGFCASCFGASCFGAEDAAGAAAGAEPPSSTTINVPSDTLSPIFTLISFTVPASGDGTSMVALSDSSVTSDCSFSTLSPTFTLISITVISLKSPI